MVTPGLLELGGAEVFTAIQSLEKLNMEELSSMFMKGAIIQLHPQCQTEGFFSNMYLIPKKDGKMEGIHMCCGMRKGVTSWYH